MPARLSVTVEPLKVKPPMAKLSAPGMLIVPLMLPSMPR